MIGDPVLASNVEMYRISVPQWVLALPIPPCLPLTSQPKLVTPVLPVVQRVIARDSLRQARLPPQQADTGALSLIQRFGATAHLNVHLDCRLMQARALPLWECTAPPWAGMIAKLNRRPSTNSIGGSPAW